MAATMTAVGGLPDPDWYFDHVLYFAEPDVGALRTGPAAQWQAWWRRQVTDDPLLQRAARSGFVVGPGALLELGTTRSKARAAIRRGRWAHARHGMIAPIDLRLDLPEQAGAHVLTRRRHAVECAGAALRRPGHVVSGRSAAILHGLPTLGVPSSPELTALETERLGRRSGAHVHGATMFADSVTHWFGVPVTCVARTLVDLARHDRRDALMAADAALRERLVAPGEIDAAIAEARGWPGIRQARALLVLADPRAESPLESLTRLALHDDGFPTPDLQTWLGPDRVDICFGRQLFVVEADGRGKYSGDELWEEKKREQRLRRLGYRVERVLWSDVMRDWPSTRARLWSGLAG